MSDELRYPDQNFAQLCGLPAFSTYGVLLLRIFSLQGCVLHPDVSAYTPAGEEYVSAQYLLHHHVGLGVAARAVDERIFGYVLPTWADVFEQRPLPLVRTYLYNLAATAYRYNAQRGRHG